MCVYVVRYQSLKEEKRRKEEEARRRREEEEEAARQDIFVNVGGRVIMLWGCSSGGKSRLLSSGEGKS